MKRNIKFLSYFVFFMVVIFLVSCKKEDPYYGMVVKVRYKSNEQPVSGATVRIYKKDIDTTLTTDARGEVSLEFKLPMILDVLATYNTTLNGAPYVMSGKAVVKLEENTTVEKVVFIQ